MLYVMLAEDYFIYAVREKIENKNNGMVTALTLKILLYIYKNT